MNLDIPWSLVIPIKDEVMIAERTIPSYLSLTPTELICCMDAPPHPPTVEVLERLFPQFPKTHSWILEVPHDPNWGYHQAHVRRAGFLNARQELILTGDIDLVVNTNCQVAIQRLAEEKDQGVGLVSCSKFYWPAGLLGLYRTFATRVATIFGATMSKLKGKKSQVGNFTGLYAFSKSRWLETEPRDKIMQMVSPKALLQPKEILSETPSDFRRYYCGEDTFLRDYMLTKYRCVYLGSVGGISLRPAIQNDPVVQFFVGLYEGTRGRTLLKAIMTTLIYLRPYYLMGYLWRRNHT